MKIKHLIIVSLLLAILTIGAVSATEDASDDLAVDEEIGGEIASSIDDENIIADSDESDDLQQSDAGEEPVGVEAADFNVNIEENITIHMDDEEYESADAITFYDLDEEGEIQVIVDDNNSKYFELWASPITLSDLSINSPGTYKVTVNFIPDEGDTLLLKTGTITVTREYALIGESLNILNHYESIGWVNDEYVVGTLTVYIDGKQYYTKQFTTADKKDYVSISVDDLNIYNNIALGNHTVKIVYNRNNTKEHVTQATVNFYAEPDVDYEGLISVGEKQSIDVTFTKGTTGTVTLYNAVEDGEGELQKTTVFKTVNIVNGAVSIPLDSLAKGEHRFILNISSSNYNGERDIWIEVSENTPGITANVNPTELTVGGNVVVTFAANKSDSQVTIELDGKTYKTVALLTGSVSETITGLSVGQHKIRVFFEDGSAFFAKTFLVTVKAKATPAKKTVKLTFKKVKIKKSAKKLVLKATVKINGKAKKGLKVTFKFKGKKYTAKTNKKGVAKVTIKKKVLKKLKKGKKVKVQASYGGKTVKYSIKVKK